MTFTLSKEFIPVMKGCTGSSPLENNKIVCLYYTEGNEDKRFILNPTTGELSCRPLDREEGSEYTLTVLAADAGRPPQSAYATLVISVLDENDNNPVFRRSVYDVTIPENATVGTEVVAVTADDADEGLNAQIVYSISNATEGLFKINNRTGMITTSG